jgi:hypothetical protein
MKIIIFLIVLVISVVSTIYTKQQEMIHVDVSKVDYISGFDESVVVSFGKNENDFHAFAIKKKDIKQGVELVSKSKNNPNFSVFGDVDGEAIVRSEQLETFAKIKVLSIDKQNQRAVFLVEATLLNTNTNELNKLDRTKVIVKGEPFLKLM